MYVNLLQYQWMWILCDAKQDTIIYNEVIVAKIKSIDNF